ncbi:putative mRNA decapping enzyme [Ordospora pajunii]|uniref:putative mRNA decapping enzyme n=1 Tax=Ordospora pajunii TaxID=3039483 RepID=UPI0029528C0D|nr:putative mRNA decapping enzyme [Ordospora pajunii]KAH9411374.1 putative mRNA decapping enzyme [Ordospora pajunii]
MHKFVLEERISKLEENIYIGKIDAHKAIIVLPNQNVSTELFHQMLQLPKQITQSNDIYYSYKVSMPMEINFRVIYPATEEHFKKYRSANKHIVESYNEYLHYVENNLHISSNWMANLVNKSGENLNEKVLYDDNEIMIVPDYKWSMESRASLHILAIFKNEHLRTIRDLDSPDILIRAYRNVLDTLATCFGLGEADVFLFFHYRPTYFRLHLHVININIIHKGIASSAISIPFHDVVHNLQNYPEYYKRDMHVIQRDI